MIYIKNVLTLDHEMVDYTIESPFEEVINATGLTLFPALIDPHIYIDDASSSLGWKYLSRSALSGGVTTLLASPKQGNHSHQEIKIKSSEIDKQLKKAKIPLSVYSLVSPKACHLDILPLSKKHAKGIHLTESSSFFSREESSLLDRLFRLASEHNLPISFQITKQTLSKELSDVLNLVQKYNTKIYLYPVFKPNIILLIEKLKALSFPIFSGTHLSYLFAHNLNKTRPIPELTSILDQYTKKECDFLWESVNRGTIDCVGSNYNLIEVCTNKLPPLFHLKGLGTMELSYPLLLSALKRGMLDINTFLKITGENARNIFNFPSTNDATLIDMNKSMKVSDHLFRTIGNYQSFIHLHLYAWPIYTISQGRSFKLFTKK